MERRNKPIRRYVPAVALLLVLSGNYAQSADYVCTTVENGSVWFRDHVVTSITYLVVGSPGRTLEADSGVFFRGKPPKRNGSSTLRFTAFGAGALHMRQQDSGPHFKICATSEAAETTTIIQAKF